MSIYHSKYKMLASEEQTQYPWLKDSKANRDSEGCRQKKFMQIYDDHVFLRNRATWAGIHAVAGVALAIIFGVFIKSPIGMDLAIGTSVAALVLGSYSIYGLSKAHKSQTEWAKEMKKVLDEAKAEDYKKIIQESLEIFSFEKGDSFSHRFLDELDTLYEDGKIKDAIAEVRKESPRSLRHAFEKKVDSFYEKLNEIAKKAIPFWNQIQ